MNIEELREYCLAKKGVTECFPFDDVTLVFKVMGKMFALTTLYEEFQINVKCNPEQAIELRSQYSFVIPGYHMDKKHWNTIIINNQVSNRFIKECIDKSYNLVINGLTKKLKDELLKMNNDK